jgi:hypothetical protein
VADSAGQLMTKCGQIIRSTVGESVIGLRPDVLRRLEFRRVRGKVVHMESGIDTRTSAPKRSALIRTSRSPRLPFASAGAVF